MTALDQRWPRGRSSGRALRFGWMVWICSLWIFAGRAGAIPGDEASELPQSLDVRVVTALQHSQLPPGGESILAVSYQLPIDTHLQVGDFLYVLAGEGEPFELGPPLAPPPAQFDGEPVYQGAATFYYRLRLKPGLALGANTLHVTASWQGCFEEPVFACFPPEERVVEVPIHLAAGSPVEDAKHAALFASMGGPLPALAGGAVSSLVEDVTTDAAAGATSDAKSDGADADVETSGGSLAERLERALARRSFLSFLLVFLGGVASSFTPCVYPIIPITISYIGGRSRGRLGGFVLSLFFVLGIAIMYSGLGVAAASSGALFGSAMQSTPVLLFVSGIFFVMGVSMLGAFDLALPSSLQTKLQGGPRTGVLGAIFMGMVTGLVASPCVGPVLVVLLAFVAKAGAIGYGFLLLFTFAVGLGMLFLVIGTFAGALNALPKAGEWMESVKHVFGVILFVMGIFYIRSLIGEGATWVLFGILTILVGTFLGAFRPVPEDVEQKILLKKGFGIVLLVGGSFALLLGLARVSGVPLGLVSSGATMSGGNGRAAPPVHEAGLAWVHDDTAAWERARREGKPVVMDFYADWCAACIELDEETWIDGKVRQEGERFVAIKMDFTDRSERSKAKQAEYKVLGLPTVIFFDATGREIERFFGFRPPEQVLSSMQRVR